MLLYTYATQRPIVTRQIPTRRHARPRVHLADRRITNLCARRLLCYSTCARSLHVGTPAHVCTVYGRPVNNLRERAGRYTTGCAVMKVFTHFGDAFFRVVRWCAVVGAPFAAPVIGAAGVSVTAGEGLCRRGWRGWGWRVLLAR